MSSLNNTYKFIVSGGGTGGHIYPAIAIADALREEMPGCEILFVGANGRMEMEKVPAAGYPIEGLNIAGFQRGNMLKNLALPFKLIASVWKAGRLVYKFRPNVVIGVGGYASGPLLWMAQKMGNKTVVQEQNAFAGITNKILGGGANRIYVAYDGLEKWFPKTKLVKTGNPIRGNMFNTLPSKAVGCAHFGFDDSKPVVLVTGGSLGARTINNALLDSVEFLKNQGVQLIWQCGKIHYDALRQKTGEDTRTFKLMPFLDRMEMAYGAADVVVARAGAGTIAELAVAGSAAILVPSPNVAEDHQTHNAMALVNKQAAVLVKDSEASTKLVPVLMEVLHNPEQLESLRTNIKAEGFPEAAKTIAQDIIKLAGE